MVVVVPPPAVIDGPWPICHPGAGVLGPSGHWGILPQAPVAGNAVAGNRGEVVGVLLLLRRGLEAHLIVIVIVIVIVVVLPRVVPRRLQDLARPVPRVLKQAPRLPRIGLLTRGQLPVVGVAQRLRQRFLQTWASIVAALSVRPQVELAIGSVQAMAVGMGRGASMVEPAQLDVVVVMPWLLELPVLKSGCSPCAPCCPCASAGPLSCPAVLPASPSCHPKQASRALPPKERLACGFLFGSSSCGS